MAKYNEREGNSCHIHLSLRDTGGAAVFAGDRPGGVSPLFEHFLAGQLAGLREFIRSHDLVTIPGTEVAHVEEAPAYNRQNAAYIVIPGPYEHGLPSVYYIAPPDPSWTPAVPAALRQISIGVPLRPIPSATALFFCKSAAARGAGASRQFCWSQALAIRSRSWLRSDCAASVL